MSNFVNKQNLKSFGQKFKEKILEEAKAGAFIDVSDLVTIYAHRIAEDSNYVATGTDDDFCYLEVSDKNALNSRLANKHAGIIVQYIGFNFVSICALTKFGDAVYAGDTVEFDGMSKAHIMCCLDGQEDGSYCYVVPENLTMNVEIPNEEDFETFDIDQDDINLLAHYNKFDSNDIEILHPERVVFFGSSITVSMLVADQRAIGEVVQLRLTLLDTDDEANIALEGTYHVELDDGKIGTKEVLLVFTAPEFNEEEQRYTCEFVPELSYNRLVGEGGSTGGDTIRDLSDLITISSGKISTESMDGDDTDFCHIIMADDFDPEVAFGDNPQSIIVKFIDNSEDQELIYNIVLRLFDTENLLYTSGPIDLDCNGSRVSVTLDATIGGCRVYRNVIALPDVLSDCDTIGDVCDEITNNYSFQNILYHSLGMNSDNSDVDFSDHLVRLLESNDISLIMLNAAQGILVNLTPNLLLTNNGLLLALDGNIHTYVGTYELRLVFDLQERGYTEIISEDEDTFGYYKVPVVEELSYMRLKTEPSGVPDTSDLTMESILAYNPGGQSITLDGFTEYFSTSSKRCVAVSQQDLDKIFNGPDYTVSVVVDTNKGGQKTYTASTADYAAKPGYGYIAFNTNGDFTDFEVRYADNLCIVYMYDGTYSSDSDVVSVTFTKEPKLAWKEATSKHEDAVLMYKTNAVVIDDITTTNSSGAWYVSGYYYSLNDVKSVILYITVKDTVNNVTKTLTYDADMSNAVVSSRSIRLNVIKEADNNDYFEAIYVYGNTYDTYNYIGFTTKNNISVTVDKIVYVKSEPKLVWEPHSYAPLVITSDNVNNLYIENSELSDNIIKAILSGRTVLYKVAAGNGATHSLALQLGPYGNDRLVYYTEIEVPLEGEATITTKYIRLNPSISYIDELTQAGIIEQAE